jgi:phage recombination protein Bet
MTTKPTNQPVAIVRSEDGAWTRERVDIVKHTLVPRGIPDAEFALFVEQCKRSGLDPLLKEIFCVARRQNIGTKQRENWVTRYEAQPAEAGMLARAERFPDFRGISASAVHEKDEIAIDAGAGEVHHVYSPTAARGRLLGAWARVVREGKTAVVVYLELGGYVQDSPLWKRIPATMIEKCARVAALRKAYPSSFGGLYIAEEMPQEHEAPQQAELLSVPPTPALVADTTAETPAATGRRTAEVRARLAARAVRETPAPVQAAPAPSPAAEAYQRILAICERHGIEPQRRASVIQGATGKSKRAELNEDDVARVEDALVAMAAMPTDFGEPTPPPPPVATKRSLVVDVADGETEEEATARQQ